MSTLTDRLAILITADGGQAIAEFRKVGLAAEKDMGKGIADANTKMLALGAGAAVLGVVAITQLDKMAKSAENLALETDKARNIFGEGFAQVDRFATGAADKLGLSKDAALQAASAFGILAQQGGLAGPALAKASDDLVARTKDIAKGLNLNFDDVQSKIETALKGGKGAKAVLSLGINLDPTRLKEEAIKEGIAPAGTKALDQQQKTLAALNIVMADSVRWQGEYAKHGADQAEIVEKQRASMKNLEDEIGAGVLPVFNGALSLTKGLVGAFDALPAPVKSITGEFVALAAILAVVGGVGSAAVGAVGKLRGLGSAKTATTVAADTVAAGETAAVDTGLAAADAEAKVLAASVAEVDTELAGANVELATFASSLGEIIAEAATLKAELALNASELGAEALTAEQADIAAMNAEIALTNEELAAAGGEAKALGFELEGATGAAAGLDTALGGMDTELAAATTEAVALDGALATADTEAVGLLATIGAMAGPVALVAAAVAGFGAAFYENAQQHHRAINQDVGLDKGVRNRTDVNIAARDIAQVDPVAPSNAGEKLANLVGLYDDTANKATVAAVATDKLGKAIDSASIDHGKQMLAQAREVLIILGNSGTEADGKLRPLYDTLNRKIDAANQVNALTHALGDASQAGDTAASAMDRLAERAQAAVDTATEAAKKTGDAVTNLAAVTQFNKGEADHFAPVTNYEAAQLALDEAQKKLADATDPTAAQQKIADALDKVTSAQDAVTSAIDRRTKAQQKLDDMNKLSAIGNSVPFLQEVTKTTDASLQAAKQQQIDAENQYGANSDQAAAAKQRVTTLQTDVGKGSGLLDQAVAESVKITAQDRKDAAAAVTTADHDVTRSQQNLSRAQKDYNKVLQDGGKDALAIRADHLAAQDATLKWADAARIYAAATKDDPNLLGDFTTAVNNAGTAAGLSAPELAGIVTPLVDIAANASKAEAVFQSFAAMVTGLPANFSGDNHIPAYQQPGGGGGAPSAAIPHVGPPGAQHTMTEYDAVKTGLANIRDLPYPDNTKLWDKQSHIWTYHADKHNFTATYADGGVVPNMPLGATFGTDTVPAMLTPGEGVVNTKGMAALGADGLDRLNRGYADGGVVDHGNKTWHSSMIGAVAVASGGIVPSSLTRAGGSSQVLAPTRQHTAAPTATIHQRYEIHTADPVETANQIAARTRSAMWLAGLRVG